MSMFGNLKSEGLEETQDRLGGFGAVETDIYKGKIKMAYAGVTDKGSKYVDLTIDLNGKDYRERVYVTNQKGENFFLNKDDKTKKVGLPGFTLIEDLCMVTVEKPLADINIEEKIIKIYDFESKKEVPTSVPVLIDLLEAEAYFAIVKTIENKNAKDSSGDYVPTAETREVNHIDKVFHHTAKITIVEARNGETEPKFFQGWLDRNKGKTRDKRTIKEGEAGTPARPVKPGTSVSAPQAAAATRPSLFGPKK